VFEAFKIYPVPARDHLNMSLVTPRNMEISVKIYTLDMKLVEEVLSGKLHSGEHQITIDLMNGKYVSGTYLIVLEGERFVSARRFIVG
jgi:hypothetical protein